jgi:hypothetical protein
MIFKWTLSYPSHPAKGKWHKINPEYVQETLCGRLIAPDWQREIEFPPEDPTKSYRVCRKCLKRSPGL